jgi:hypothetical protein
VYEPGNENEIGGGANSVSRVMEGIGGGERCEWVSGGVGQGF